MPPLGLRRLLRGVTILVLFAIQGPFSTQAQEHATVRGLVTSADDGTALVNANVLLSTLSGERVRGTATDPDGYYELQDLSPGRYLLQVSYLGFHPSRDTVSLEPGRQLYNVALSPSQQTLDEVRVEARRGATRRAAGLQSVGAADLERIPTPGPSGDLAAYLQTMPGVVSIGDRGGQLFIRGGTPSQNLILVDGIRIMKPFHFSGLYSTFPEEIVKSANVHAGGFGAQYMGAVSSVIDVRLRRGNAKEYQGSLSISPFLASARVEGPIREETDSFLAVARRSIVEEMAGPLYRREIPLGFYDVTTRYDLQLENASCSATAVRSSDRGRINPNRALELSWSNTVLGGRCLMFGEELGEAITFDVGYSHFQNQAGTPDAPQRQASLERTHLNIETEQDLFSNTLNYGVRWIVTDYTYDLAEKFTSLQIREEAGGAVQAYASMDFTFGDRLTVTPSFGTHATVRRLSSPTYEPRLRVAYRPDGTDRQEINLAIGKYNQVAEAITDERDAGTVFSVWRPSRAGDPLLRAFHGILGYRQQIGSSLQVSVEGYAKTLSNIPVPKWSPVARFDVRTALADGLAYGFDLRTEIENDPFYLFLGYGWSSVTYRAGRDNLGAWREGELVRYAPPHDRRHQVNVVGTYSLKDFTFSANWKFASGRPYTKVFGFDLALELPEQYAPVEAGTARTYYNRPYNARLPTFHRLDISVERAFDLSSNLFLEAKAGAINAYDRQNVFYYDINSIERVNQSPLLPYLSLRLGIE